MPRIHSDWLKAYMEYTSHSEAPDAFHFWAGVGTIAAALRGKVWLDMAYFQWKPNFYIVFVAPPGIVSKSTTMGIGTDLLSEVEGVNLAPSSVTWQRLVEYMGQCKEEVLLPDDLYHPMCCITVAASELGSFLDPRNTEMVDVLVDLWDGKKGVWEKSTKTQGSDIIENPWINMMACTTPSWIAGNFPDYMIGGGFTSRCIFVYAERKRKLVAYPNEEVPADFERQRRQLVHDLEQIADLKGEVTMTKDALQYGREWYEEHYNNVPPHLNNERFASYLARKQTHVHKLAIVLSAARREDLAIDAEILQTASQIVTALEHDMPRVFEHIGQKDGSKIMMEIISTVHAHGEIPLATLFNALARRTTHAEFKDSITGAIYSGQIEQEQRGGTLILRTPRKWKEQISSGTEG